MTSVRQNDIQSSLQLLTGKQHTVLLGRAAAGIWVTLKVLGYANRPILLPANTCYVVLWAVLHSGNYPVLVDVDPNTANLSIDTLERANVENAAATIPCHMYGLPASIAEVKTWAQTRGIFVIEDAALALGAQADGEAVGSWGDVAVLSFGLGKIINHQVGGALVTDDEKLAAEMSRVANELSMWEDHLLDLSNQWHNLYWALHQYEDRNPRLLTLYPSLFDTYRPLIAYQLPPPEWEGLPKALKRLDKNLAHRHKMAELCDSVLRGLAVRTLDRPTGSILWRYPLLVAPEKRDDLLAYLWEHGIHDATRWYPSLRYMTSALAPEIPQTPTPNADLLGASIINLALDPEVDATYVERTANLIVEYFEGSS
jgi:dTDP-4-amino-4,6-dideoxygalactose transaminase